MGFVFQSKKNNWQISFTCEKDFNDFRDGINDMLNEYLSTKQNIEAAIFRQEWAFATDKPEYYVYFRRNGFFDDIKNRIIALDNEMSNRSFLSKMFTQPMLYTGYAASFIRWHDHNMMEVRPVKKCPHCGHWSHYDVFADHYCDYCNFGKIRESDWRF